MNELLSELNEEMSHLSSKSLGPIGFDYRRRTKLERLMFLIAKEFCSKKFEYDLGGLSYTHRKKFFGYVRKHSYDLEVVQTVKDAFEISDLICALSSSDPYVREDAKEVLGGLSSMFKNLGGRIKKFMCKIEKAYPEA